MPSGVLAVVVAVLGLAGGLAVPRPAAAAPATGLALAWGNNEFGQLGDGTTTNRTTPVQVHLPPGVAVTQVAERGPARPLPRLDPGVGEGD